MKQRVPITNKSSKFKGATQHYVVKLPKSAGARHYCPKILRVPGTLGTRANSSPVLQQVCLVKQCKFDFQFFPIVQHLSLTRDLILVWNLESRTTAHTDRFRDISVLFSKLIYCFTKSSFLAFFCY